MPPGLASRSKARRINMRVLKPVLERADELLADRSQHPLPRGVTPHKLRHTCASVLIALGRDPRYVMEQLGHTDPKFTGGPGPAEGLRGGRGFGTNWHRALHGGHSETWGF